MAYLPKLSPVVGNGLGGFPERRASGAGSEPDVTVTLENTASIGDAVYQDSISKAKYAIAYNQGPTGPNASSIVGGLYASSTTTQPTTTAKDTAVQAIASNAVNGDYVVVWIDTVSGYSRIRARRYDKASGSLGSSIDVTTGTTSYQYVSADFDSSGNLYIVGGRTANGDSLYFDLFKYSSDLANVIASNTIGSIDGTSGQGFRSLKVLTTTNYLCILATWTYWYSSSYTNCRLYAVSKTSLALVGTYKEPTPYGSTGATYIDMVRTPTNDRVAIASWYYYINAGRYQEYNYTTTFNGSSWTDNDGSTYYLEIGSETVKKIAYSIPNNTMMVLTVRSGTLYYEIFNSSFSRTVTSTSLGSYTWADVTSLPGGDFVVAWRNAGDSKVQAQRYTSAGVAQGSVLDVASDALVDTLGAVVAQYTKDANNVIVGWQTSANTIKEKILKKYDDGTYTLYGVAVSAGGIVSVRRDGVVTGLSASPTKISFTGGKTYLAIGDTGIVK